MKSKKSRAIPEEDQFQKVLAERWKEKASFKKQMDAKRSCRDRIADFLTNQFGTIWFTFLNFAWFVSWILINTGQISSIEPFDPFPFSLLTTIVSLEAIFLSLFVLISQNRATKIADIREELDLQINVRAEHEITHVINVLDDIRKKMKIRSRDRQDLKRMKTFTNFKRIERELEKELA